MQAKRARAIASNYITVRANPFMATLYLAGMGLCNEKDIPLRTIEILKRCKNILAENYTNLVGEGAILRLERIIGKEIKLLGREEVEGEKEILEAAKKDDTALIVPGDPMAATTHNSLILSAKKLGIETKILHASSIITASAGASGLQIYKFGKTATITYWRKNFEPDSFIDIILQNQKIGAHTLCLLDIDVKMGPMKPSHALEILMKAQDAKMAKKEIEKEAFDENSKIIILSHAGWEDEKIWAGKIGEYGGQNESGPAVIIFPSRMHFMEEEAFESLC